MLGLLVVFRSLFRAMRRGWKDPAFRGLLFLTIVLLVAGMLFYRRVEHWTLLESLYFSVITLTTVGFQEVHPLCFPRGGALPGTWLSSPIEAALGGLRFVADDKNRAWV